MRVQDGEAPRTMQGVQRDEPGEENKSKSCKSFRFTVGRELGELCTGFRVNNSV